MFFSTIMFELETRGIPERNAKEIEQIIFNFLWDNKKPHVAKNTLKREKYSSGLNRFSISDLSMALNIRMLYKILHADVQNWNVIGKSVLSARDKEYYQRYFICTCSFFDKSLLKTPVHVFYMQAIKNWCDFLKCFEPLKSDDLLHCKLFGNHKILSRSKPLYFKSFLESNIVTIKDVWDYSNRNFISERELLRKLKKSTNWIAEWMKLKSSIPKEFTDILKLGSQIQVNDQNNQNIILSQRNLTVCTRNGNIIQPSKLQTRDILNLFVRHNQPKKLHTEQKWEEKFKTRSTSVLINWNCTWSNLYRCYSTKKAKQFQWKFLHNCIFTENKLSLMRLSNGICNMCKSHRETLIHLFWECEKVKPIWKYIQTILEEPFKILNIKNIFSFEDIAFGLSSNNVNLINTFIFETKWHIWKFRNFHKFRAELETHSLKNLKISITNTVRQQIQYQNTTNENRQVVYYRESILPIFVAKRRKSGSNPTTVTYEGIQTTHTIQIKKYGVPV
ncbi:uncharacterized protein LOC128558442 [Mercenaria mercenaria]|uniref:uncharacterized protein LOC128558442 n=1 Tax=Mercenaria mercenaria TaxID=6596 RepID=UPI00234ECA99|nr:uncharacterized protein LOC128558442 [Mercenaria mercenaria]XP_053403619.1 uncharacterized protein LOC128558442 [Mercenaria mercenaria]